MLRAEKFLHPTTTCRTQTHTRICTHPIIHDAALLSSPSTPPPFLFILSSCRCVMTNGSCCEVCFCRDSPTAAAQIKDSAWLSAIIYFTKKELASPQAAASTPLIYPNEKEFPEVDDCGEAARVWVLRLIHKTCETLRRKFIWQW